MSGLPPSLHLDAVVEQLRVARKRWRAAQQRPNEPGGRDLPSRDALKTIVAGLRSALFPMRLGPADLRQENEDYYIGHTLHGVLHALIAQVRLELARVGRQSGPRAGDDVASDELTLAATRIVREFAAMLPAVRDVLDTDVQAAFSGDPAAQSVDEVLLTAQDKASGYTTEEVGHALNDEGIAVRTGHHCAQPILRRFGLETTVRPSLAFYNTREEVDRMVGVVQRLAHAKR